jgi:hypothetical protein
MRILYCPIFEQGSVHETAVTYKRGLFNALRQRGDVLEWDYLANDADTRYQGMVNRIDQFAPTHVLTQFHAADVITPAQMAALRARYPDVVFINWSGDSWAHSLTAPPILELARQYHLWLVAAPDVLPVYEREGIRAAYWNIAYEPPVVLPLPDMPRYDVVWLATVINDRRRTLMERLKALDGVSVGIYGDWERADGRNVYHFPEGEALYKNAKLAIADNVYQDTQHYISNRPMQILAAGGALLLHQHVPRMADISYGWTPGQHYVEWTDWGQLETLIRLWLTDTKADERRWIVNNGYRHVMQHHTFECRVTHLFDELLPALEGVR